MKINEMNKALFVWGGWEGHEPKQCVDIFVSFLKKNGFKVELSNTLDIYLDIEKIKSLDLIVHAWTMGFLSREQEKGLLDATENGVGIAGWHGGMGDSFRKNMSC